MNPTPDNEKLSPRATLLMDIAKTELSIATTAETQRERFVFVVTAIAGFLVASVGWDKEVDDKDLWQAVFLVILGLVGALQVMKLHTKKLHHFNRYRAFRDEVDQSYMGNLVATLRERGDENFAQERPVIRFHKIPSQVLWAMIPIASLGIGVLLLIDITTPA